MDAREEHWVEGLDLVGGEEQYAAIIFKVTQADEDNGKVIFVRGYVEGAHKTATMAFRSRSFSERCSRKTSASSHGISTEVQVVQVGRKAHIHTYLIY